MDILRPGDRMVGRMDDRYRTVDLIDIAIQLATVFLGAYLAFAGRAAARERSAGWPGRTRPLWTMRKRLAEEDAPLIRLYRDDLAELRKGATRMFGASDDLVGQIRAQR